MADMLAVFDGKRQVEQHQVGRGGENIARNMLERFAGLDLKTGTGKDVGKLATNGFVVLNDIDQRHVSSHFAQLAPSTPLCPRRRSDTTPWAPNMTKVFGSLERK